MEFAAAPASEPRRPGPTFGETGVPIPRRTKLREQGSLRDSTINETSAAKRPRSRPSQPLVTVRDSEELTGVGEQFGKTYVHLRAGLSRKDDGSPVSDAAVRQWVGRMERLGLVTKLNRLGVVWVTLTAAGYERMGLTYSPWNAPESRLAHCDAVNRMRAWWESDPARVAAQGSWTSERRLLAERRRLNGGWHISDAELRRPEAADVMAVEVELHVKTPRTRYVDEVINSLRPDVSAVLYVCPPALVARLTESVTWAQQHSARRDTLRMFVRPLPHMREQ